MPEAAEMLPAAVAVAIAVFAMGAAEKQARKDGMRCTGICMDLIAILVVERGTLHSLVAGRLPMIGKAVCELKAAELSAQCLKLQALSGIGEDVAAAEACLRAA